MLTMRSTPPVAELDQSAVDVALQQEVRVLLAAVLVHAAAGWRARLVALVELVMLVAEGERQFAAQRRPAWRVSARRWLRSALKRVRPARAPARRRGRRRSRGGR
jgi:hypothetical protein